MKSGRRYILNGYLYAEESKRGGYSYDDEIMVKGFFYYSECENNS